MPDIIGDMGHRTQIFSLLLRMGIRKIPTGATVLNTKAVCTNPRLNPSLLGDKPESNGLSLRQGHILNVCYIKIASELFY